MPVARARHRRPAAGRSRGVPGDGAERPRALDREPPGARRRRHAHRPRQGLEFPADWANKGVRPSKYWRRCARCSSCRSTSWARPTGHPPTERPSSAGSPDTQPGPHGPGSSLKSRCERHGTGICVCMRRVPAIVACASVCGNVAHRTKRSFQIELLSGSRVRAIATNLRMFYA